MNKVKITREVYEALRDSKTSLDIEMEVSYWLFLPGEASVEEVAEKKKVKKKTRRVSKPMRNPNSVLFLGPKWKQRWRISKGTKAEKAATAFEKLFLSAKEGEGLLNSFCVESLQESIKFTRQESTATISYLCKHGYLRYD